MVKVRIYAAILVLSIWLTGCEAIREGLWKIAGQ